MAKVYRTQHFHAIEWLGTISFFFIMLIQYFIRPNWGASSNENIRFCLGIAPNFLGGIAMTIALFMYQITKRLPFTQNALLSILISFLAAGFGLWLWEYFQLIAHRFFDTNDVIASWCGAAISFVAIYIQVQRNFKKGISVIA